MNRDPIGYAGGMNVYGYAGGNPITHSDPSGLDWLNNAANFSAGAGDILSFGLTGRIRQGLGVDDVVNRQSGAYMGGEVVGAGLSIADAGVGAVALARGIRAAGGVVAVARAGYASIGASRATVQTLYASYRWAANVEQSARYLTKVKELGQAFAASGGKFVNALGKEGIDPISGKPIFGLYNAVSNTITLYKGANKATVLEELIHGEQARDFGYVGKGNIPNSDVFRFEQAAEQELIKCGFIPQ